MLNTNTRPDKIMPEALNYLMDGGKGHIVCIEHRIQLSQKSQYTDPLNTKEFKYTFQKSKNFTVLPIQASVLGHFEQTLKLYNHKYLPEFHIYSFYHIEENFVLVHDRIKLDTYYEIEGEIIDVIDKGEDKGAILMFRVSGYQIKEKGQRNLAFYSDGVLLMRTMGGCGIKSNGNYKPYQKRPKRQPDLIVNDGLFPNQVFYYRLNNAPNPIHIDPQLSKEFGYPKPMVHGMLSYTTIVRVVLQHVLDYDQSKIKGVQVRFTGLVFDADRFLIKIWKETGKIFFEIDVPQRDSNVALGIISVKEGAKL